MTMVNSHPLSDVISYDLTSPSRFRWTIDVFSGRGNKKKQVSAGDVAGSLNLAGYWCIKYKGKIYTVHRIIWEMFVSEIPNGCQIDHIDRDMKNNDLGNLRVVTIAINSRNRSKRSDNKSGVTGIHVISNKYGISHQARWVDVDGKERAESFKGEDSLNLAIEYRNKTLIELNGVGFGYSLTHGE